MLSRSYRDDLTDKEWDLLEEFVLKQRKTLRGRRPKHSKRELLEDVFKLRFPVLLIFLIKFV